MKCKLFCLFRRFSLHLLYQKTLRTSTVSMGLDFFSSPYLIAKVIATPAKKRVAISLANLELQ